MNFTVITTKIYGVSTEQDNIGWDNMLKVREKLGWIK